MALREQGTVLGEQGTVFGGQGTVWGEQGTVLVEQGTVFRDGEAQGSPQEFSPPTVFKSNTLVKMPNHFRWISGRGEIE